MIGRRTFLALSAGVVVTACGSSGTNDPAASAPASTVDAAPTDFVLVQRYPNTSLTPGRVRLPVSIASADGTLRKDGPATLTGTLLDSESTALGSITAERHGLEMVIPYWPFVVDVPAAGIYYLAVDGADGDPTPFQVFDTSEVKVPSIGSTLAGFDTPTTADARGVDPLCTRSPEPCPFHDVTLNDALASGKPVVYLIGTPAHCATGTCAPGLEYLVDYAAADGDRAVFVHAEVFADNAATTVAPAVRAAELDYEPVIFVTDASGTITERIDIIWDGVELTEVLDRRFS